MKRYIIFCLVLICSTSILNAKNSKPLILVTSSLDSDKELVSVNSAYYKSVIRAGGIPILMPVVADEKLIAEYVALVDGVVIIGGNDISPSRYGEENHSELGRIEPLQDSSDFALIKKILKAKLPVLAVCRGAQAMNVAHGGSLYQDIPSQLEDHSLNHRQKEHKRVATHSVAIKKGSNFSKILGKQDSVMVNSFHHQAAKRIGKGLEVVAWSSDGVIEGLETKNGLVICPQFHPEGLAENSESIMINFFNDLVKKAAKYKKKR